MEHSARELLPFDEIEAEWKWRICLSEGSVDIDHSFSCNTDFVLTESISW